jgi:hypothetical protein
MSAAAGTVRPVRHHPGKHRQGIHATPSHVPETLPRITRTQGCARHAFVPIFSDIHWRFGSHAGRGCPSYWLCAYGSRWNSLAPGAAVPPEFAGTPVCSAWWPVPCVVCRRPRLTPVHLQQEWDSRFWLVRTANPCLSENFTLTLQASPNLTLQPEQFSILSF